MKPVSFGSMYKVYVLSSDLDRKDKGIEELNQYCRQNNIHIKSQTNPEFYRKDFWGRKEKVSQVTFISAREEFDHRIDMICNNHQLEHTKVTTKGSTFHSYKPSCTPLSYLRTLIKH